MKKNTLAFFAVTTLLSNLAQSTSLLAGPAPGITYLEIHHVYSTNQGWENISAGQFSTNLIHGGTQLRVVTVELGYGSRRLAKIKSAILPASANYQTDAFCNTSNYLAPCRPGQTVVGFVRYWKLDNYAKGQFYYENTSTNYPFNKKSDFLTIR
jgi:hypothetical protein